MSTLSNVALTDLLPSTGYLLSYSLPLLFLSILLTFAGAFLTLDRTRSFAPHYSALPGGFDTKSKKKFHWLLEGGIGGLATGYVFGGPSSLLRHVAPLILLPLSPLLYLPFASYTQRIILRSALTKVLPTYMVITSHRHDVPRRPLETLCSRLRGHLRRVCCFINLIIAGFS